jgi:hypothetical protein
MESGQTPRASRFAHALTASNRQERESGSLRPQALAQPSESPLHAVDTIRCAFTLTHTRLGHHRFRRARAEETFPPTSAGPHVAVAAQTEVIVVPATAVTWTDHLYADSRLKPCHLSPQVCTNAQLPHAIPFGTKHRRWTDTSDAGLSVVQDPYAASDQLAHPSKAFKTIQKSHVLQQDSVPLHLRQAPSPPSPAIPMSIPIPTTRSPS